MSCVKQAKSNFYCGGFTSFRERVIKHGIPPFPHCFKRRTGKWREFCSPLQNDFLNCTIHPVRHATRSRNWGTEFIPQLTLAICWHFFSYLARGPKIQTGVTRICFGAESKQVMRAHVKMSLQASLDSK